MADFVPFHITVPRTARYYQLGAPNELVRDVWIVCHGFSQLAASFLAVFTPFEDDSRLIVAPEALSRFYIDSRPAHTRSSGIGATWMTREDRESEIGDIVTYLDALYERILEELAVRGVQREMLTVHALGFSQGATTVARWAALGKATIDHLVAWSHAIPTDVNIRALGERLPGLRIDVVYGKRDEWITEEMVAAEDAVLAASGVAYKIHAFSGGHVLSRALLRQLMER